MSAQAHLEETEELRGRVLLIGQERDQLQEALQSLRQQKQQLQEELEERMEAVCQDHRALASEGVVPMCLRTQRRLMGCSVPQVAQAHCGFGLPEMRQEQDEEANRQVTEAQSVEHQQQVCLSTDETWASSPLEPVFNQFSTNSISQHLLCCCVTAAVFSSAGGAAGVSASRQRAEDPAGGRSAATHRDGGRDLGSAGC